LTYNTSFTDFFEATFTSGTNTVHRHGDVTVLADGYGTLILPTGTFTNVLRVKIVEDYQDDVTGFPATEYDSEIFMWYKQGYHNYLLSITQFDTYVVTQRYGSYLDEAAGINDNNDRNKFTVYPNPANEILNLDLKDLSDKNILLEIFDIKGRTIFEKCLNNDIHNEVNISDIPEGIYMLKVSSENYNSTQKLIIH